jgi:TonB family protein
MGYQALLFCPDEKTARTVTQVLNELEFNVECCTEPFAAVKKLMGTHFDALVVDCDNEQNATLLFKSAHSSTSNQASLAVAVVEGQAGVAKAFRIGANLVLTKPINIEQAKGTLRVARGLLRKSEPGKAAAGTVAPTPAPAPAAKPVAVKPAAPAATPVAPPMRPAAPAAVAPTRPAAPVVTAKPIVPPTWPAQVAAATAASASREGHEQHPVISAVRPAPVAPPVFKAPAPVSQAPKLPVAVAPAVLAEAKPVVLPAPSFASGGAASAPAPAREAQTPQISEAPTGHANSVSVDAPEIESTNTLSAAAASTFTFGGANVQPESSGGSKKIVLGVAAAVIVAAGLYVAWSHFQGSASQPASSPTATSAPAAVAAPQPAKPVSALPKPVTSAPSTPVAVPSSQGVADVPVQSAGDEVASDSTTDKSASANFGKLSGSAAKPAGKTEAGPLVVKGGSAPAVHTKPAPAADAPAPNMTIAMPGSGGPPANLVSGSTDTAVKPILQTINISQGVSQGLLVKKVQPQYPRNALNLHVEGPVELMATVSKTGEISHLKVLSGETLLKGAAVDAVKQWKYKPYLLNGEPVEIQTQITINFKLPH